MKALRTLVLGMTLAVGLTCAAVFAQQPTPAPAGGSGMGGYRTYSNDDGTTVLYSQLANPSMQGLFKLQSRSAELAQKYVKTEKDDEKKEIRKQLADLLGQQFDQHTKQQQEELEDIEKQIAS